MRSIFIISLAALFSVPAPSFAQEAQKLCSKSGYTIITMNGVFTDENGAKKNKEALEFGLRFRGNSFKGELISVDYLHNESHLGGIGDILKLGLIAGFFYRIYEIVSGFHRRIKNYVCFFSGKIYVGNFYAINFF